MWTFLRFTAVLLIILLYQSAAGFSWRNTRITRIKNEQQIESESELPPTFETKPIHSRSRPTRSPLRPIHIQSRPTYKPSNPNYSQFRPTDNPSRPKHSQTRPKPNQHEEYKPIYPFGPGQSKPNYRRRGPVQPSIDTHLRPVQGGAVSIQNKQTVGRRQNTDEGPLYS